MPTKVYIAFYSRTGNTAGLAEAVAEGARAVADTEVLVRRVAELAPPEVVAADPKWKETQDRLAQLPEASVEELPEMDAIILGSPTRYGNMSAQLKNFVDQTGPLWAAGKLINKVGAVFGSSITQHSGQESTLLTMMVPLYHFGMMVVGVSPALPETATAGSFYGATSVGVPTEKDLVVARALGKRVATAAKWLKVGREAAG